MYRQMDELRSLRINSYSLLWLFLAVTLCMGSIIVAAFVWHLLLKGAGVSLSFPKTFSIVGTSLLGKYLPGNLMHYAGRFVLGKKAGISMELMTLSVGAETILALASVFLLLAIGIILDPAASGQLHAILSFITFNQINYVVISGLLLLVFLFLLNFRDKLIYFVSMLNPRNLIFAFALSVANYLLYCLTLLPIISGLHIIHSELIWSRLLWGFCLAWGAGFIMPGAPGGIGIREAVIIKVFGSTIGVSNATVLAITLRVVSTFGDVFIFFIAWYIGRRVLQKTISPQDAGYSP